MVWRFIPRRISFGERARVPVCFRLGAHAHGEGLRGGNDDMGKENRCIERMDSNVKAVGLVHGEGGRVAIQRM